MAIRDQGYRHWEGEYTSHRLRWWTITKTGVRAVVSSKVRLTLLIILVFLAWIYPIGLVIFGYAPSGGQGFSRGDFTDYFEFWQGLFVILMAAVVGSGLVANDLGSNALHIYLSKPLRRADYLIGKAGVIVAWLSTVTFGPALFLYMGGLMTTNDLTRPNDMGEILGEVLLFQALVTVVVAALILAFSALSRKWTFSLIAWVGFYLLSGLVAGIAAGVSNDANWLLLGLSPNLANVGQQLLEQPPVDPTWVPSFFILVGLTLVAAAVYVGRIVTLEVAE
jgi:ABC-2 type transport system permease protein